MAKADDGDDANWKSEAVMEFMKSPDYTVPVMDFIDENCVIFDAEEESPLELSKVHEGFVEKVFGLLEKFLEEIGVTQEEFSAECQQQMTSGGKNAFVFQQIMAADDFQAFKKMMVQRNRQMSYENLKRLQRMQIAAGMSQASKAGAEGGGSAPSALAGEEEEEEEEEEEDAEERRQIEEAIRLSRMTFVENDPDLAEALRISAAESVEAEQRAARTATARTKVASLQPDGMSEEAALEAALKESLKAAPPVPASTAAPSGARSAAVSAGPASAMSDQGEVPLVYDATEHVCATSAGAVLATPDDEDLLPTDPEQLDKIRSMPLVTDAELRVAKAEHELAVVEHAIAVNQALARACEDEDHADDTGTQPQPPPPPPPEDAVRESGASSEDKAGALTSSLPPIKEGRGGGSSALGALPPLGGARGAPVDDIGVSVSVSQSAEEMSKVERKRAQRARREAEQELLLKKAEEAKGKSEASSNKACNLSSEELAARKAHLEEQRVRLLDAKKKERDETMRAYQASKEAQGGHSFVRKVSEKHQQVANEVLAAMGEIDVNRGGTSGPMTEEEKRAEMRKALAGRLRNELLDNP